MTSRAITLDGFEAKFRDNPDPWQTFSSRYEAAKREALRHVIGPGRHGRALELAAGNGSNTAMIANAALRLDVCEGTPSGTALIRHKFGADPRISVHCTDLAEPFPASRYDLIVISEVLYYLDDTAFARLARETARTLRPGGRLVLAHHGERFPDAARDGRTSHRHFLRRLPISLRKEGAVTARRWRIISLVRPRQSPT